MWSNPLAGVVTGCSPEFIEMMRVGQSYWSGSALGTLRSMTL